MTMNSDHPRWGWDSRHVLAAFWFVLGLGVGAVVATVAHADTPVAPLSITAPRVDPAAELREITDNDAEAEGLEVKGSFHVTDRLVAAGGVTYGTQSTDPKFRYRAALAYALTNRLSLGASWLHVTARHTPDFTTPAYDNVAVKATYALAPHATVTVIGENLLGARIIDSASADSAEKPKPTVRASLSFDY